jgi:type III secretion protein C
MSRLPLTGFFTLRGLGALMLVLVALAPARAADIPWQPGLTFSRTSVDDDIRGVLRAILGAEGLSVLFRPGVAGKISFEFTDTPLQTAFEQIVTEYGLRYEYNGNARTVTILPAGANAAESVSRRFLSLQKVNFATVRQALLNFGLGLEGVAYDPATNTLAIAGDERRISQLSDLIKTLEERTQPRRNAFGEATNIQTKVIRLRFADVGPSVRSFHGQRATIPGILETLQAMLGTNSSTASPPFATQTSETSFTPTLPAQIPSGLAAPLARVLQNANGGAVVPGLTVVNQENAAAGIAQHPLNRPSISIDQRTNSVIVRGTPEQIAAVEAVVEQLDQPVKMVEIEVIIATAQIGVASELGVAWRGLGKPGSSATRGFGIDTGTTGGQATATTGLDPITLLPSPPAAGATVASFLLRSGQGFLQAQLKALAAQNKARLLSAPHIVTLDNVTARITRAQDIYVPVDTGGLNGQGLSQIQTGLTLQITPSIVPAGPNSKEDMVRLSLNATDSAPVPGGAAGQITVAAHEVQTDVLVPNGGTFVIGGLFDHTNNQNQTGIPFLKNLPLVGQLFRDDNSQYNLGETIFFITPRIVDEREVMRKDIALSSEAVATIAEQRQMLGRLGNALDVPDRGGKRGSAIGLEEDQ